MAKAFAAGRTPFQFLSVLGMAAASHFSLAAIAKPPLTYRDIRDGSLIHWASRIKRASDYDAILRILD